ncbi:hypothetical protein [Salinimicrobium sediminilitoris]|uniref:hypothetical protein n=1 Tax=Salinimicrobium sediminilitoris TaxID=2876715 RepID=UPI001E6270E8|nr:hypothetical protein [Salinimicrobium sediminilitoris]MCC8360059.1 hypothetical protein [Salinimicrobium sediminilitoris]
MKGIILTVLFLVLHQTSFSQETIIKDHSIPALNKVIDSLENNYKRSEIPTFLSLPQTTGDYFYLKTEFPDDFINALKAGIPLDSLIGKFPNLQIDRDLLIIKNNYVLSNGEEKLELKSFQIKFNSDHKITLEASDSLVKANHRLYYLNQPDYASGIRRVRGFYLHGDFVQKEIPKKYSKWVNYTSHLVPPTRLFSKSDTDPFSHITVTTPIDSLVTYFAKVTHKPVFDRNEDFKLRIRLMDQWEEKRAVRADSLFRNDPVFKNLLFEALDFAETNQKSNGELEVFVAQLISRERALNLMRNNQQIGTCSFDNGPLEQQKRMARLAAEIPDWNVFIQSFLNVMNDHVSRVANSNIASESRKTYIEELTKLDLDVRTLLLGSNMRIAETSNALYFSDGSKVAKAFTALNETNKDFFEAAVDGLIKDEQVDAFNKLHFYNTLSYYHYFLEDSPRKERVAQKMEKMSAFMPVSIRSRMEEPHKELKDLLFQESEKLEEFNILDSSIGNIYSYSYGGDCWMAEIQENAGNPRLIYDLTMPIEEKITPLSNFLKQKPELTRRIEDHSFIKRLLDADAESKLYLKFTEDRSFYNFRNKVLKDVPGAIKENWDFKNAVSFYISYPDRRYVRFILFENNDVMVLKIPRDYSLPNYRFEDLVTKTNESFLSVTYESYKIFNEKGEMLN